MTAPKAPHAPLKISGMQTPAEVAVAEIAMAVDRAVARRSDVMRISTRHAIELLSIVAAAQKVAKEQRRVIALSPWQRLVEALRHPIKTR